MIKQTWLLRYRGLDDNYEDMDRWFIYYNFYFFFFFDIGKQLQVWKIRISRDGKIYTTFFLFSSTFNYNITIEVNMARK